MNKRFYLIDVEGCVEPSLVGPFGDEETLAGEARKIRARQDEEDALFWLAIDEKGEPSVGPFAAGLFEGEEEAGG